MAEDNLKKVWQTLYDDDYDVPDYDTFKADMEDDNNLHDLWEVVGQKYDVPEYEQFRSDMGFGAAAEAPQSTGTVVDQTMEDINRATGHMPQEVQDMAFSGQPQMNGQSLAEKNNPQMFQQPAVDPEPWKAEGLTKEQYEDIAWMRQVNAPTRQAVDEQGRIRENAAPGQGVAPEQNTGNRTYQVKESWGDELSREPSRYGELRAGWRRGARFKQLGMDGLYLSGYVGQTNPDAAAQAEGMSDADLIATHNRLSSQINKNYVGGISGFARTPEGQQIGSQLEAIEKELHARDLGFAHASEMSGKRGEVDYRSWTSDPEVATEVNRLSQLGNRDAEIADLYLQGMSSGDMSAAKRAMLASAALYAKENNVDMDTAYAKVEGDAFNAVMRNRMASEMDAIYNEEKAAQEARQAEATKGINPGTSPADAVNFELQSRRAGNERETLNAMARRAINESPTAKMYYNMQMRSYIRQGLDPVHAKAASMNDLRNLFRDREVERMSPTGDWGYVGGSAFYNNMPAELFRGLTNFTTGDYEYDQILDEAYARYGQEKASTMAKVGASVAPFVVDMALGSFKVPGMVAKIGQQTISKGLLYGARWSLGVADDVILRRMGGNILYRTLMGGLGGGLNFMTYNAMSAAVRGFKDNNFSWNTVVEEGGHGFADGIVFGGVNGLAGKLTDVAKGAWAIPAELGVLAVEGGTFTALDYMRTGELTPESVGTSFGMAIAGRMTHFGQWASDVAARVNGTKWKNTVTGPVRLSKETRDELQDRYPEICRLMSDGELAKAMVKGVRGKVTSQDAMDTGVAIDKEWEAMQNDSSVPFEVRRMVNYALNGQVTPKPVTCNYRISSVGDATYGETLDINGNVIDRYKLESEKDRVNFEQGVALEAERNRIGLEQNAYVAQEYYPHLTDAVEAVAAEYGMDPNELLDNYYKKDIKGKAMRKAVDKVEQLYLAEIEGKTDIVSAVNDKYGVNIEEALKVPIHERSEAEHNAIAEYEQRLTGRYDEAQDKSTAELVAEDMEQSRNDGFEAQGDERADIKERLEDAANALTEMRIDPRQFDSMDENAISDWLESRDNNADEVDAVMEYLDARSAFEGIRDRVQDEAGKRIEEAAKETDDRTNNDTGMIHPVVMGDDREAFVVSGRVEVKADGTIDLEKSDRDIVVRYPDEEQPVMTTADKIKSGEPTIDPEAAKQETADGIMQEVAGEAVSQMNRDLAFNEGDTFTVLVDGKPVELTVVGTDPNTGNPILQDSTGRRAPGYPDILQQMHDEWREWVKNGGQAAVDNGERRMDNEGAPTPEAPRDNAAPVEERPAEEQAAGPAIMPTPGQGDPQEMLNYFRASGMSDRVADRTITNNIVAAHERLVKAERELNESKETDPQKLVELENAVDMAQRELDYWNAVARLKNGGGETAAQQRPTEQTGAPVAENEMQPVEESAREEYQGDGMSDEMRERMDDGTGIVGIVDNIARQLGLKVRDWDGPEGIPGYIDPDNGVIYINRNRVEGTRDTYRFTLGHELTHGLKKLAEDMGRPELYEALKGAALSAVRVREGSGYDKFVSDMMNRYRSAHYMDAHDKAIAAGMSKAEAVEAGRAEADRVTQDFIEEEIVCDTVGELLSGDESRARELLEQVEDKSVMQRIKDYFTELLTKVRDAFGAGSKEYDDLDNVINRFNEMYNEVLKEREEMGTSFGYTESGVDGETSRTSDRLSVSANFEGMGFKFWDDHLDADGKKQAMEDKDGNFYVMLGDRRFDYKNHITAEDLAETDSALNFMLGDAVKTADNPDGRISPITAYRIRSNYAKLLNLFLDLGAAEKGGVPNLERNYQMVAETAFRCVSTNGDKQYGVSLDITRVCKKNEAVINTISRLQLEQGYGATPAQILDIYLSTHEEGYQVPCPVCYVFSRYIRNGKFASAAINGMEMYGQHLPGGSDPWSVERWVEELGKLGGLEDVDPDQGVKDFEDLSTVANDAINRNLTLIDDLGARLATELNKEKPNKRYIRQLEKDIKKLADEYKAACDYFGQMSQTNWIKNFAIRKVNGSWKMWEDARLPEDMEDFKAHALDLRRTAETIENYPAIQRLRKSGGSASGKEIHQASNNEMGEAIMGIGQKGAPKYRNYYKEAMETSDPVEREKLLKTAREKFDNAVDFARKQNLRGGQRMWSWSDNIERLSPDVISNLMQLEMLGAGLQSYSKQLEGVEMVARMNGYVNGSLMAKDNGYQEVSLDQCERDEGGVLRLKEDITDTVYDTWHKTDRTRITAGKGAMVHEVDGKNYVLIYDDVIGIDAHGTIPDEDGSRKLGLFDLNNQYDRAGNILVTMNDMHSKLALADDRVHFIIPWHSSGANQHILAQMFNMLGQDISVRSTDYTPMQEEKDYGAKKDGKMSVIPQHLREVWDAAKAHAEERGWSCGVGDITTTGKRVENNKAQMEYRRLRDAIMDGTVKEGSKDYKAIMADEFLKQVYDAVQDAGGKMTADDKKYIYPYEYWDKSSTLATADENGWRYMEYCRRLGRRPKFSGKYGKGDSWSEEGDFTGSKGYWKTLIDRRMYDREGNFQDMTPIDSSDFDTDLVNISKMREKYTETRVADDEGEARIVQNVQQKEMDRTGSYEYPYGIGQGRAAKALSKVKLTGAEKKEMIERTAPNADGSNVKFSIREEEPPKKTKKVYKLFNVFPKGHPHAGEPMTLFIDTNQPLPRETWLNADAPDISILETLDADKVYLIDADNNVVTSRPVMRVKNRIMGLPRKSEVEQATKDGSRWVTVTTDADGDRAYHNVGINGADGVTTYAMRPGWHATDAPSARHIGAGRNGGNAVYRKPNQRWFEVEIAADYDYNEEARSRYAEKHPNMSREDIDTNMKGDIPERIPKDGYYNFKTNSNANPNQSWYISGAIKIGRPLSEAEARRISREMGVEEDLPYKDGIKDFDEDDFNPDGPGGGKSIDSVVAEAEQMTETNPTDGQKESGNYRKGHVKVDGFDISIEQPKGSVRSGVDADGKEWSQEMHNTYGYIRGTEGVDGDHIDVFLSDHLDGWNGNVYVVDQVNKDGSFDEHKVMYGFNSEQEARDAYLSNYEEGWTGLGNITGVSREEFKKWVDSSHRKNKPFAEYKNVKPLQSTGTEDRERFSISERTDDNGNEVYTETREDGTKDREVVTMPDGSRDVTWFDEAGRKKEVLSYYSNGEVRQVNNYDSEGDLTRLIQYDENRRAIRHWEPRIGTDWERDENGVARGMSNGVEMVRYSLSEEQREAQTHSANFKRWFGDWERDPENASKVVDDQGRPLVVYHQTNAKRWINRETGEDWEKLDWRKKMEWENKSQEEWEDAWEEQDFYTFDDRYARQSIEMPAIFFSPVNDPHHEYGQRTIAAYLDIKNPAINPDIPNRGVTDTAGRDAMEALKAQGYDGFIRTDEDGNILEYGVFDSSQVKSATENNGDFSRENPDIRFSLSEEDRDYMDAVERGDTAKASRMVAEAAKRAMPDTKVVDENGRPLVVYHVDRKGSGFTEFDTSMKWNRENMGSHFGTEAASDVFAKDRPNAKKYAVYLDIKNPLEVDDYFADDNSYWANLLVKLANENNIDDPKVNEVINNIHEKWPWIDGTIETYTSGEHDAQRDNSPYQLSPMPELYNTLRDVVERLGYDGFKYMNLMEDAGSYSYVAFRPEQIKSAEAVTYDDDGDMIPLSQRFDEGKKDIRFSLGAPYQGSKNKIAKDIVDILPKGERFVDLFSGGGAVTHAAMLSGKYGEYRVNDINPAGLELFLKGINGDYSDYQPREMSAEEFKAIKGTPEGLMLSYGGLGRNVDSDKDSVARRVRRVQRLEDLKGFADQVESSNSDYRDVELEPGDVVYADIPYQGTNKTGYREGAKFDKQAFSDWALGQDVPIYVSEQSMPAGWVEVASWEMPSMNTQKKRGEKLFVQERFAGDGGRATAHKTPRFSISPEEQERQTHSDNFKNWFGDWENDPEHASKVVGAEGRPLVVYRGGKKINTFEPDKASRMAMYGPAFYATPSYVDAQEFGKGRTGNADDVQAVYLDIRNPWVDGPCESLGYPKEATMEQARELVDLLTSKGLVDGGIILAKLNDGRVRSLLGALADAEYEGVERGRGEWWHASAIVQDALKELGYDGVVGRFDIGDGHMVEQVAAFEPTQIKSATENNGEFSRENPDIRFNLGEEIENYRPEQVSWERGMLDRLLQNAANNAERNDMRKQATREVNRTLRGLFDRLSAPGADAGNLGFDISRATQAAARAQRGYDRWTVDELVSMAKSMLKSGMYKELRPYEVQRLVNMINQGVGRREIQDQMNTVFDVLMKANLRGWSAQLKKLMSTKPYSINSQTGVRTIGQVDGLGGKILTAMRRGLEMTGDELTQRIAEVSDRIDSDDTASHELEGLMLAQQYNDLVGKYDADNKNIKDLIREQQEKIYMFWREPLLDEDGNPVYNERTGQQRTIEKKRLRSEFGGLDAEGNRQPVSEENKALRQRVEATVADLENSMRENWVRMSEGYDRITDDLGGNVAAAVTRAKEFRENEKLRKQQIYHAANSDLLGVEDNTETVDPSQQVSPANWSFVRGLLGPLATFEKMMRFFGRRSANGEGRLFNMFVRRQIDCGDREWRDKKAGMDEMDNKAKELFGKKWMTMGNEMRDGKKFPFITLSYFDKTGKPRTIDLRQDEAVYIYCVNKMRDGQMKLNAMGIDGDMVEQIVQRLDPRLVELADWYQGEFLPKHRNRYNETYERMFGTPMAHIDNYIHLNINKNETASNQEIGQPIGDQRGPTYVTGSLKERKTNVTPIELRTSIFDLAWSEHDKMEHWNAWGEFSRDLKDLINYRNFKAKVRNMKSVEFGNGKELLDNFSRCAAIVTGDYDNPGRHAKIDRAATNLAKGVTSAKIGFRAFTALKQTLSFPAFFSDARPDDLLFAMGNAEGTIKWAMENLPGFSKRWQSRQAGDTRLMETDSDWKVWKNSAVKTIGRYSMLPNASVDCLTVAIGARGVYRTAKRRYLDYGFSEAQAEQRALQDAAISYNASQQSSEGAFTSAQQVDCTLAGVATTVFRNASMGYERRFTQGLRNLKNMAKRGYREEVIENTKKQMMEEGLTEEQAERAAERVYNRMKWHSMADVVNFGFVLPFFWNLGPAMVYILGGEDDEQKQELVRDSALHALYGPIEGLSMGGTISELANIITGSMLMDEKSFKETMQGLRHRNFNPLPIVSDMQSVFNSFATDTWSGLNDVFNIVVQMGVGVNPETVTNMTWGIIDACQGDMDLARKTAFAFLRFINAPASQVDKLYMDELGITKDEASRMSWDELAKKYARYHAVKDATVIAPFLSDEAEAAREERFIDRFYDRAQERLEKAGDDDLQRVYGQGDEQRKMVAKETAKRAGLENDRYGKKPTANAKPETVKATEAYQSKRSYADMAEDVLLQKAKTDAANAGDDDRADAIDKVLKSITKLRNGDSKKGVKGMGVDKATDDRILEKIRETRSKALKELGITR